MSIDVYEEKRKFVERYFQKSLKVANPSIETVVYTKPIRPGAMEIVTITRITGDCININVTCDSLNALMRDVLQRL